MAEKHSTIRLSPGRKAAIDDVRHATVSRQAWVDTAIDRALEAALSDAPTGASRAEAQLRSHFETWTDPTQENTP